ncbi:MAG: hypothetical protein AB7I42_24320 [Bradyrhizobium sp.]|uniref:hypothetical protein n=1 Tax=Bradyrhizobium sp. TaxID=376 RepID=UPI003D116951
MARFRSIDDSPNERAPGPNWNSAVLEAYRDDANRAIANREFELTMQQRGMENATDIAMKMQQQRAQEQAQKAAFEQQREMENLRTRNDIHKEREQYNFQANKELERIRTAQKDLELQPWPENVKAQMRGVLKAQEMGIKADPKNFAPKPPTLDERMESGELKVSPDKAFLIGTKQDGSVYSIPYTKPVSPGAGAKPATPKPPDMMKIRQQAITELNPDGTTPPSATDIRKKMREIIETSDPELIMADEEATTQPTAASQLAAAGNFTPGKPFRTPMDAVSVVAASQQQPGAVPPARVMQALEYLLPIKDSLEPREAAVLEAAKVQLIEKGKTLGVQLSPQEVAMLRRLAKGG